MGINQTNQKNMNIYFNIEKKLDHFTLCLEQGFDTGTLVIQGPSGSGKTTALNLISGLDKPDFGEIRIGENMLFNSEKKIDIRPRDRKIGYMFQNYALFPNFTVLENINYGIKSSKFYKEKNSREATLSYASEIMEKLKIMHLANKNVGSISGGEKQRVALARAIVLKPKLLLLDEPFSALDEDTKHKVYGEFLSFKNEFDIPTILITHSSYEAKLLGNKLVQI
jgi:molybdate transport system ATP-binding protein